jgi:1-acyl-sn-glycerol-3-phosphate acyltransferase
MLYSILKPIAVVIMRLLFRLEAHGVGHVPSRGPVLLFANHSSVLDPPLVGGVVPRPVSYLAKAELFRIPLFGGLIRRLNARPVRREGADAGALREALRTLKEDRALLVFPEGTRGEEGRIRPFKAGAGMLAVLSEATVVPALVEGSGRVWPRGRKLPRPGKVTVTFGPPLRFPRQDAEDRKQLYERASREMMQALARLSDLRRAAAGTAPLPSDGRTLEAVGKSTHGRNGQHGQA